MPHYNFIEIGTSNFGTLIEKASDDTVGLSVEPITPYLDQLPNKKNVKKINVAVSYDNIDSEVDIYFIPESVIKENNLKRDLVGCNSINDYHPAHLQYKNLVETKKIRQIPIGLLFNNNDVKSVDLLKIDTEGGDSKILTHLFYFLKDKSKSFWPKTITFESNKLTPKKDVDDVIELYESQGYTLIRRNKFNTTLKR